MTATAARASETTAAALSAEAERAFEIGAQRVRDVDVVREIIGRLDAFADVENPIRRVALLACAIEGASAELHLLAETLRERVRVAETRERARRGAAA